MMVEVKEEGPNRGAVGKEFRPAERVVTAAEIEAYARAVDDERGRYLSGWGEEQVAPPIFAVQPLFEALETAMLDEALGADMLRLVHGDQEMKFYGVIRPGDRVEPRSYIGEIVEKSSGWLIDVHQELYREEELLVAARSGLFVRRKKKAEGGSKKGKRKEEKSEEREVVYREEQVVAGDQPQRYADASGDHNPIHVNKEVALKAGLPDVILHGLCTMAFGARALVNGVLGGKVEALESIKVRFATPVVPGTRLITSVYRGEEEGQYFFETTTDQGRAVLSFGEARKKVEENR